MDDTINGVALLLTDIEGELSKKRITNRDKIILKSLEYLLKSLPPLRSDIYEVKNTSYGYWANRNPQKAFLAVFFITSFLISDIRQPVFAFVAANIKVILAMF
jgi:hypothetical protein